MAKTIKFNLILDGNPVRDLEDLRNNFSIEDILDLYNKGLLQRWLKVREYNEYLDKVEKIKTENNIEIIKSLVKIFELESDENKIEEGITILEYINERKELLVEYEKENYKVKSIIDDYHSGYYSIINDIIEYENDMPRIKANIREIEKNYMGLFDLNHYELYHILIYNAPLAVFAILMNDKMRDYYVGDENSKESTKTIYKKLKEFISNKTELKEKIGSQYKVFKGNTEAYWKDIEPKEKKVMIISMESGNFIRNAGVFGEELGYVDVDDKFLILEGIDYKSNNANHEILYMEV